MKIKSLFKNVILTISLFAALMVGACNDKPNSAQEVLEINFSSDTLYLSIGGSKKISYSVIPAELLESAEIKWTSSKEDVVTVSSDGIATGVAEGKAEIIARSGNASATLGVVVSETQSPGILISDPSFVLEVGDTKQLSYTITNSEYAGEDVTWESSNQSVATVNDEGLVTAKSKGESIITVKCGDISASAIATVIENEVFELEGLELSNDDVEININESYKVYCYTVPAELQEQVEITWEIDDEDVAVITEEGVLFGVSQGTTRFRARSGSFAVEGDVAVVLPLENQLEKIELNVSDLTLGRGDWFELVYTLTPSYLQDYLNVSWESTDESIAEVDGYGIVVAKQYGECDIIATCDGLTATARIKVVDDTEYALTLAKSKVFLPYGKTYTMNYYVAPYEYQDQAWVTWETSNPEIATVDEYGVISSGGSPGTATITARWEGCEDSAEVTVFTMFLGEEKMEMFVGDTKNVPLYVMPDEQELMMQASYGSLDKNVVTVSETGVMTAVGPGTTYVVAWISSMTVAMNVTIYESYCGYPYVDLDLPSGTKWATHNVGARNYTEIGEYYAWGEIETKSEYTLDNSRTLGMDMDNYSNDIAGWSTFDVATTWGGSWMMPTYAQWQELFDECKWSWSDELPGFKVTGKNGKYIYLIAGGKMNTHGLEEEDMLKYWTSTTSEDLSIGWADEDDYAGFMYGGKSYYHLSEYGLRNFGLLVRPVFKE